MQIREPRTTLVATDALAGHIEVSITQVSHPKISLQCSQSTAPEGIIYHCLSYPSAAVIYMSESSGIRNAIELVEPALSDNPFDPLT